MSIPELNTWVFVPFYPVAGIVLLWTLVCVFVGEFFGRRGRRIVYVAPPGERFKYEPPTRPPESLSPLGESGDNLAKTEQ